MGRLKLDDLIIGIKDWAIHRDLDLGKPVKQVLKLGEEYGELCEGIVKGKSELVKDSIGDMFVVLIILCMQLGISFEDCVRMAYDEIKDRDRKMVDGVFVKEGDL
jgi:NTP pyrophosphatase (non-canonical NTP hydrolase)